MTKKPPPNLPSTGDTVKRRGYAGLGKLGLINKQNNWCEVKWETEGSNPRILHLYELEKA